MNKLLLAAALLCGLFFAYVDSRPSWDDTGVLVGAIVLSSGMLGALGPRRPWLWALAVGAPMPLYNFFVTHQPPASAVAIVFALVGAYAGAGLRKLVLPAAG
jgi:hypothetical protein